MYDASCVYSAYIFFIYIPSYLPRTAVGPAALQQTPGSATMTTYRIEGGNGNFSGSNFGNGGTSTVNNITGQVGDNIVASKTHKPDPGIKLDIGQKKYFEKLQEEQFLTTLDGLPGTETSIIKIATIRKSVCMIKGAGAGTGFLAKLSTSEVAFFTAGHVFTDQWPGNIDFSKITLHFGNDEGDGSASIKNCTLAELGPFRGSIGYNGHRKFFPGNALDESMNGEDYCVLVLTGDDVDTRLQGLDYLECGDGDYLKYLEGGVVATFGHPGEGAREGDNRPLRVSYGKEKIAGSAGRQRLYYDNDTLGGNSGSPVIGRGSTLNNSYKVKGIHVASIKEGETNGAQSIRNLEDWISTA